MNGCKDLNLQIFLIAIITVLNTKTSLGRDVSESSLYIGQKIEMECAAMNSKMSFSVADIKENKKSEIFYYRLDGRYHRLNLSGIQANNSHKGYVILASIYKSIFNDDTREIFRQKKNINTIKYIFYFDEIVEDKYGNKKGNKRVALVKITISRNIFNKINWPAVRKKSSFCALNARTWARWAQRLVVKKWYNRKLLDI